MSKALVKILEDIIDRDPNSIIVTADMYKSTSLQKRHPDQYLNVGISETNAVSVASGLAYEGKRVFLYCVAGFTVERAYEQIKYCIGAFNMPVYIISSGIGWGLSQVGRGHHPTSDLLLMYTIPNLQIDIPASFGSADLLLNEIISSPHYMRMGCSETVHQNILGKSVTILTLGSCYSLCLEAIRGYSEVGIIAIESLKEENILNAVKMNIDSRYILIEDHMHMNFISELLLKNGIRLLDIISLPSIIEKKTKTSKDLQNAYGFDRETIQHRVLACLDY